MSPASSRTSSSSVEQPWRMTPSPNAAGGGSSIVRSMRSARASKSPISAPKRRSAAAAGSPAQRLRRCSGSLARPAAMASVSRGLSVRCAARLASRSRSGSAPERLARARRADGASLDQPADGVVPRLDGRPVEQRLGEPAPQHPRAHRRRASGRSPASSEPSRCAVAQAFGQLQAATRRAVQHHRAFDGVQLKPVEQPEGGRQRLLDVLQHGRRRPARPAGARPGPGWRRRRSGSAAAGGRPPGAARTTRPAAASRGRPAAAARPARVASSSSSWLGIRHSAGPSRTRSAASSALAGRPAHLGRRELAGADVDGRQPGRSPLHDRPRPGSCWRGPAAGRPRSACPA